MAVLTVEQLIETLNKYYDPKSTLVVTWWDSSDVSDIIADIYYDGGREPEDNEIVDVWERVADTFDGRVSDQVAWLNDELFDVVKRRFDQKKA